MSPQADSAVVPLDVATQWVVWLNTGHPERVRNDLVGLLTAARAAPPADPPSSAERPITTR